MLDLARKTALPKRFSLNQERALDSKDIKEIKAIIDLMKKHDLSVFEIEKEGFRLKLQRGASAPQAATLRRLRRLFRPKPRSRELNRRLPRKRSKAFR